MNFSNLINTSENNEGSINDLISCFFKSSSTVDNTETVLINQFPLLELQNGEDNNTNEELCIYSLEDIASEYLNSTNTNCDLTLNKIKTTKFSDNINIFSINSSQDEANQAPKNNHLIIPSVKLLSQENFCRKKSKFSSLLFRKFKSKFPFLQLEDAFNAKEQKNLVNLIRNQRKTRINNF